MAEAIGGRGRSKRPGRIARACTGAMALAAVALILQVPAPVARAGGITSAAPTGPLKMYARITLPSTAGEMFSSAASAEAPDGAVFMASVNNNGNTVVWVVDGDGPAAVAEHVSGVVHAVAAGTDNLYVATYTALTAFNRQTGNRVESWALPKFSTADVSDSDLVAVSAFNGEVLISIVMGNQIDIYHVNAASSAGLKLIAIGTSSAFGPDGTVYFVHSGVLVRLSADGAATVGPQMADHPNRLGGGVQYIDAVAGGVVWVIEPAGQGEDATLSSYNDKTLTLIARWSAPDTGRIVDTQAGALVLGGDGYRDCPQPSSPNSPAPLCVYRLSSTGALTDSIDVGTAWQLLGPYPAVITSNNAGTTTYLERLH